MIIAAIFVIIVLALVLVVLSIMFWYISLPIIAVIILLAKREKLEKFFEKKKTDSNFKKSYQDWSKKAEKEWDVCKEFKIDQEEATTIFGAKWNELRTANKIFSECIVICNDQTRLFKIPKYLALKLSQILEISFRALEYESQNLGTISSNEANDSRTKYESAQAICKRYFEHYAESHNYKKESSQKSHYQKKSQYRHYTGTKEDIIQHRLEKFAISEYEASIIFGKSWRRKLAKNEIDFFFDVWKIEIKLISPYGRYRKRIGNLYSKVIEIIQIVDQENPDLAASKRGDGEYSYGDYRNYSYDDYKDYQDTAQESESDNIDWAFQVLELEKDATMQEIKAKYRKLSLQYHPDKNKSVNANQKMSEINQAYHIIMEARRESTH